MKITFFIDNMSAGGAQRVVSVLSSRFVAEGHKVSIVIRQDPKLYGVAYKTDPAIKLVYLTQEAEKLPAAALPFKKLRAFVAKHSDTFAEINEYYDEAERALSYFLANPADVVFSFLYESNIAVGLCAKKLSSRIVVAERNFPDCPMPEHRRRLRDFAYRKADVCVFQTEEQKLAFPNAIQKKGMVIPNPIKEDLPEPYAGERNHIIVNHCGYKEQKNVPLLIDAFALIAKKYPDYRLTLYGYGEQKEMLQKKVDALGLSNRVSLLPFQSDIHSLLLPSAMFVMSSDYEGMPNALMEAMGLGLPVISTDCKGGGAKALIKNHENGILTPLGNANALADAMAFYIEHPDKASEYASRATKIREILSVKGIAEKWLKLCK